MTEFEFGTPLTVTQLEALGVVVVLALATVVGVATELRGQVAAVTQHLYVVDRADGDGIDVGLLELLGGEDVDGCRAG